MEAAINPVFQSLHSGDDAGMFVDVVVSRYPTGEGGNASRPRDLLFLSSAELREMSHLLQRLGVIMIAIDRGAAYLGCPSCGEGV